MRAWLVIGSLAAASAGVARLVLPPGSLLTGSVAMPKPEVHEEHVAVELSPKQQTCNARAPVPAHGKPDWLLRWAEGTGKRAMHAVVEGHCHAAH